jgi:hypothetical protein
MTRFSSDRDILKYEAVLFGDLHFGWQVLCRGEGAVLNGTSLSKTGEDFVSAGASAGGVVYLRSETTGLDGVYEIVSVESAEELTVSVLRSDEGDSAVGPGDASDVVYQVSTFDPQSEQIGYDLTQYFGIRPGRPESGYGVEDVLDVGVLRQASVFAVIAGAYATLGSGAEDGEEFWRKSLHYQKLFERARERCRLTIDTGGDGTIERTSAGGSVRIVRD